MLSTLARVFNRTIKYERGECIELLTIGFPYGIPLGRNSKWTFRPSLSVMFQKISLTLTVHLDILSINENHVSTLDLRHFDKLVCPGMYKSSEESDSEKSTLTDCSIVICNLPLPSFTQNIFEGTKGSIVICDGGANRLVDYFSKSQNRNNFEEAEKALRKYRQRIMGVVGDLDSLKPEVQSLFEKLGIAIVKVSEQESTDLMKAMHFLREISTAEANRHPVFILSQLEERFDQTLNCCDVMYRQSTNHKRRQLYILNDKNVVFHLPSGSYKIILPMFLRNVNCGLLPIAPIRSVTTEGYKWNLDNRRVDFGYLVSSSNKFVADSVVIKSSDPLLLQAEVAEEKIIAK